MSNSNRFSAWLVVMVLVFTAAMVFLAAAVRAEDQLTTATLTIDATPLGGGTCFPGIGTMAVEEGQTVELEALPAPGYGFVSWSWAGDGNPLDPLSARTSIYIIGDISLTARFEPK